MKPRDLAQLSINDTLDLDSDGFATLLPGGCSPLSLLSPNGGSLRARSPSGTKPATATAPTPPALPTVGEEEEEENEPLGALPQLGAGGGRRGGGRRPDPRRQSLAISQLFAGLSEGAGLLGDSELAVGDEDIQVPLARSGRLLGGAANHSSLFCDPDTGDLLDTELPSPQFPAGAAAPAGAAGGAAAATPVRGNSAVAMQAPRASVRRTPAMRASIAVFGDLSKACEGQGLDDFDSGDFQLQESSKVKELAFLFKMDGATPRSSVEASWPSSSASLRASADLGASASQEAALDGIRQRLQQFQAGSSSQPEAAGQQQQHQPVTVDAASATAAATPHRQQPAQPAAAPAPVPGPLPQPAAPSTAPTQPRSEAQASKAAPPARVPAAAASAGRPAASKLPAPLARASRLRPPSNSNGFFSNAATASRQPAQATGAATHGAATSASSANSRARPPTRPGSAGSSAAAAAGPLSPAASRAAVARPASKAPALSRLAPSSSRIPTPSKPAPAAQAGEARPQRAGMFSQRTLSAAAARQQRATAPAPASAAAAAATTNSARSAPAQRPAASAAAGCPANLTPTTARLRLLEQNPELAFGGGTKLADSPACPADQQRKLTAEERHLQEWADHL
ncbi:hypothetical protein ABPG75_000224 [Micractinium tetrahymenae]